MGGGYPSCLKALVNPKFLSRFDDDENIELWYRANSHITASEKQILITHWVGNAYQEILRPEYVFRRRLFEKTGCLITADRSEDKKILPEGLPNYKMPSPIALEAIKITAVALAAAEEYEQEEEIAFDDFRGENELDDSEIIEDNGQEDDGKILDIFN